MSHLQRTKCNIRDLSVLQWVIKNELPQLEFVENKKTFVWYDKNDNACEHVIRFAGQRLNEYEIGLREGEEKGIFVMYYDTFSTGRRYMSNFGKDLGGIVQPYAVAMAQKELKSRGYKFKSVKADDGKVRLVTVA